LSSGGRISLLVALTAGVVAVATIFVWRMGGSAPPRIAAVVSAFPTPPNGAVVYAREAGPDVLALGVVPRREGLLLQASVLDGDGQGVSGRRVVFSVRGLRHVGTPCGAGCYRATVPLSGQPDAVSLALIGRATSTNWRIALPAVWPPPDGAAILARAGRVWRALRSVAYVEHLASDSTNRQTSDWRVAAPDRAAYSIRGSGGGIVIGARRWDRSTATGRWLESQQTARITQPVPFWVAVTDAHVLGTVARSGRAAWIVSFFDPRTPAWFEATVDKRTGHTLVLRMFAAAHFMHDVYRSFDHAPAIVPPR
jgi:hypothetical protein